MDVVTKKRLRTMI